jgi:hypothetical protein
MGIGKARSDGFSSAQSRMMCRVSQPMTSADAIREHPMPGTLRSLLVASTLGVFVGFALCGGVAARPPKVPAQEILQSEQDAAVAAIERSGGRVAFDDGSPDRPATGVTLFGPDFNDDHLVHVEMLTSLRSLDLTNSKVTDAGLAHLKGLTKLRSLDLTNT